MTHLDLLQQLPHYLLISAMLAVAAVGVHLGLRKLLLSRLAILPPAMAVPIWRKMALGVIIAGVVFALSVLPVAALQLFNPTQPTWTSFVYGIPRVSWTSLSLIWLFFLAVSVGEELFFRGVLMALFSLLLHWQSELLLLPGLKLLPDADPEAVRLRAWLWFGSGTLANLVISVAFGFAHHNNPNVTLLAVINIGLAGFALGQLYWTQGNLSGAIVLHWLWNALQASFGIPVSGVAIMPPALGFGASGAAPGILSGGSFGIEGSLMFTLAIGLTCAWITWAGLSYALRTAKPPPSPGQAAPSGQDA